MLRKTESFARALAVLSILEASEKLVYHSKYWLSEAYQNGREQGVLLFNGGNIAYYICIQRRSDILTVYKGEYSMQSISEDAYNHSYIFENVDACAEFLIKELTQ